MLICSLKEGDCLLVSDRHATLDRIVREGVGVLRLDDGTEVTVSWDRWVFLFPSVMVSVSRTKDFVERLRLMVQAPLTIPVSRRKNEDDERPDGQRRGNLPS